MPRRHDPVNVVLANAPVLFGLLQAGAVYLSHDPSRLQYLFLSFAAVLLVGGGLALGVLRVLGRQVSPAFFVLVALGLAVALFPEVPGIGYRAWVDPVGTVAVGVLLASQVGLCVRTFRQARHAAV